MFLYGARAGVVGRGRQRHVAVILLEQTRQVFHPAEDILLRQQGIADPQLPRCGGHQLGQTHRPLARDRQWIESGFRMDQRPDQRRFNLIGFGGCLDGAGIVIEKQPCGLPVDIGFGIAGEAVVEQQQLVMALFGRHVGVAYHPVLLHRFIDLDLLLAVGGDCRRLSCVGLWGGSGIFDRTQGGGSCGQEDHLRGRGSLAPSAQGDQQHMACQHPCFQP